MFISDQDIDFSRITDSEFEELCFDLLYRLNYKSLVWRRAGPDAGRDIEGQYSIINPLVGEYTERWFIECKRYTEGVSPEKLNSKIAWADAEKPDHLLFILSSHLTTGAREWLEKIKSQKPYIIHIIEGKALRGILIQHHDLVTRYCLDKYGKLLLEAKRKWLIYDVLPDVETLAMLAANIDPSRLSRDDVVFLWCSKILRADEYEKWCEEHDPFSFDYLFHPLKIFANVEKPILQDLEYQMLVSFSGSDAWDMTYKYTLVAKLLVTKGKDKRPHLYGFVRDSEGEGIEMLIEATGDFPTKIRHIPSGARREEQNSLAHLLNHTKAQ